MAAQEELNMAAQEELNLDLSLRPYDPWVVKKKLSDSDTSSKGFVILPKQDFEAFIIPEMQNSVVQNLEYGNGVEVKVHIVEEGHQADDYTLTLVKRNGGYMFGKGWPSLTKAKGYKINDEIGLMWDRSSGRFLFHHIP